MGTIYNEWKDVAAKRDTPYGEVRFRIHAEIIERKRWAMGAAATLTIAETPEITLQAQFGSDETPGTIDKKRLYVVARLRLNKETARWEIGRDTQYSWRKGKRAGKFHYDGGVVKWSEDWKRWDIPTAIPGKQRDALFKAIEGAANTLTPNELQTAYTGLVDQAWSRLMTSAAEHQGMAQTEYDRAHRLRREGVFYPPEFQAYLDREGASDATQTKA